MIDGNWIITLLLMACPSGKDCKESKYEFFGSDKADLRATCNQMFNEKSKLDPKTKMTFISCDANVKDTAEKLIEVAKPLSKEQEADQEAVKAYDKEFSLCKKANLSEKQCVVYANEAGKKAFNRFLDGH